MTKHHKFDLRSIAAHQDLDHGKNKHREQKTSQGTSGNQGKNRCSAREVICSKSLSGVGAEEVSSSSMNLHS